MKNRIRYAFTLFGHEFGIGLRFELGQTISLNDTNGYGYMVIGNGAKKE